MTPGRAPQEVGIGDPANQFAYLAIRPWPTGMVLPGEASPIRGEALSMPAQDGFGLDEKQSLLPVAPEAGQGQPKDSIQFPNPGASALPAENRELLTECEILERQIRPAPSGGQEKGEEPPEGRDHGPKCHVRSAGKSMESTRTAL